jgi:hypothetical protein
MAKDDAALFELTESPFAVPVGLIVQLSSRKGFGNNYEKDRSTGKQGPSFSAKTHFQRTGSLIVFGELEMTP